MARQRTSPYLAGVRSRLWRFIPASPVAPGQPVPMETLAAQREADELQQTAAAPVVALIRRLPLLFDE
jgi:hypothetical protein